MDMDIANDIKAARKAAGLTQKELAEKIDKSFSSVQKYELGLVLPPIDVVQDIAKALNVDPYSIMNFDMATKALDDLTNDKIDRKERINAAFDLLNETGQLVAVERIEELTRIPDYQKEKEPAQLDEP